MPFKKPTEATSMPSSVTSLLPAPAAMSISAAGIRDTVMEQRGMQTRLQTCVIASNVEAFFVLIARAFDAGL